MTLTESESGLFGALEYNKDMFDAVTARRLAGHFERALNAVAGDAEQPLWRIPLMTEPERHQLLNEWNATQAEYPRERLVHELFEEQVRERPEAVAVVFEERALSYGELNRRANRLAHYLRELGVRPDERVGICVERNLEMVVGLLAILKAGGAYVPLDPAYPPGRLVYLLEDSAPVVLLTHDAARAALAGYSPAIPILNLDSDAPQWAAQSAYNPDRAGIGLDARSLAYVIYTSGSTGLSKGVMVEHGSLVNLICWHCEAFRLTPGSRSSCVAGFGFDASTWEIWPTLSACGALLLPSSTTARDPERLLAWWEAQSMDVSFLPTPMAELAFTRGISNQSLGALLVGGDQLRQLAPPSITFSLINNYGPTETAVVATSGCLASSEKPLHIGSPISNTQIYILNADRQPAPIGVKGEIYIGGAGVAQGYLRRPELTAERFLPDCFSQEYGARVYMTGDLGRWLPSGKIEFLGRNDFQVKIRGYRIELGEIEARLLEREAVREAVVIAREDTPGDKRLVAYYTTSEQTEVGVGAEALRTHLSAKLPEYMLPAAYVRLESLPLGPNGKLDRKALPAPEAGAYSRRGYEAPQGETETLLAEIWAQLLGHQRVSRHDNFFELGGHSLLAMQVTSRLRQALAREAPVAWVFEAPTPAQLAARLEAGRRLDPGGPELRRLGRQRQPLSFAQERLWLIEQLAPGGGAYTIAAAMRLEGWLRVAALGQSFQEVLRRHEALRARFVEVEGRPAQEIDSEANVALEVVDLEGLNREAVAGVVEALARGVGERGFDLSAGRLLRVKLLRSGADEHALLVVMHHIISDGWSMGVMIREVGRLYQWYAGGAESGLEELKAQYGDYTEWQRSWLTGEALDKQVSFWKAQLADSPEALDLPLDHVRPPALTYRGASVSRRLPESLLHSLRRLSLEAGCTLFMTLLAAFKVLLSRYSGQEDVVVGAPTAGRYLTDIEDLIGFFVNPLALRTDLSGEPTFRQLLHRVRKVTLGAYSHQDAPFEIVLQELQPRRDLSRTPLFQVFFNMLEHAQPSCRSAGFKSDPAAAAGRRLEVRPDCLRERAKGRPVAESRLQRRPVRVRPDDRDAASTGVAPDSSRRRPRSSSHSIFVTDACGRKTSARSQRATKRGVARGHSRSGFRACAPDAGAPGGDRPE